METAQLLGCQDPQVIEDLREQDRPDTWIEEFHIAVARAFNNRSLPAAPSCKPAGETQRRVLAATRAIVEEARGTIVLVGHGTAWVLIVAALTGSQPSVESWRSMMLPDHCAVDNGVILRDWGSWRS